MGSVQRAADAVEQQGNAEGLGDVVEGAGVQRGHRFLLVRPGRTADGCWGRWPASACWSGRG
jgi:hypothetical protein